MRRSCSRAKGQTESRGNSRPKRGGCPHLDRGRRPTSGAYRVNDARICLGPSMTTKKQPTRAGRSTRASLNAGPMGARTNPSPHKPPNFLPVSITHRASQAGTKIARATRGSHFCDCLALANNPEKTRRIPGYTNRRDRRVRSSHLIGSPSYRQSAYHRQRERFAISAAPPRQPRRGGRAQVTVGRLRIGVYPSESRVSNRGVPYRASSRHGRPTRDAPARTAAPAGLTFIARVPVITATASTHASSEP